MMDQLKNSTTLTQLRRTGKVTPPPPVIYSGPAIPTAYDPKWRTYTNLLKPPYGPATVAAFKAMPETVAQVARDLRFGQVRAAMPTVTADMTLAQITAALTAAQTAVATPYATETAVNAAYGKTVHNQDDVVAAFKAATTPPTPAAATTPPTPAAATTPPTPAAATPAAPVAAVKSS
jgi:hypothetical protein